MTSEPQFITALQALATHPAARGLLDDVAVLEIGGEALVLTHDMLVEGVHYLPDDPPADVAWKLVAVPGLELQGQLSHEGRRAVTPDETITLPGWTRIDAALHYDTRLNGASTRWTLGIENLANKRYWKESPYQFGHVYLYPLAARTWRASVQTNF